MVKVYIVSVSYTHLDVYKRQNKDGDIVIPMLYDEAKPFREEVAYVVKNGMAGYIDKEGNLSLIHI